MAVSGADGMAEIRPEEKQLENKARALPGQGSPAHRGEAQALPGEGAAMEDATEASRRRESLVRGHARLTPGQGVAMEDATTQALPGRGQHMRLSDGSSHDSDGDDEDVEAFDALNREMLLPPKNESGEWEVCLRNSGAGECFPVKSSESSGWQRFKDPDSGSLYWYSADQTKRRWFYDPT